ncbi:MAG: T9SS type A sorting domain-containing protein [Crocinitomicaceae bacterium]|nr:T9SS type A sorting domain-containing protein [Crocinitomicaceae bacterium]
MKKILFSGAFVSTHTLSAGSNTINVNNLTNGIYFLKSGNGSTVKFVKE